MITRLKNLSCMKEQIHCVCHDCQECWSYYRPPILANANIRNVGPPSNLNCFPRKDNIIRRQICVNSCTFDKRGLFRWLHEYLKIFWLFSEPNLNTNHGWPISGSVAVITDLTVDPKITDFQILGCQISGTYSTWTLVDNLTEEIYMKWLMRIGSVKFICIQKSI
jgi:hypothetical protein